MGLTKQQAQQLFNKINATLFDFSEAEAAWQKLIKSPIDQFIDDSANFGLLRKELIEIRKANLARRSIIIDLNDDGTEQVRVYHPTSSANIEADVGDIFARGLDSATAVAEILTHTTPKLKLDSTQKIQQGTGEAKDPAERAYDDLLNLIAIFQSKMQAINAIEIPEVNIRDYGDSDTEKTAFLKAKKDQVKAERKKINQAIEECKNFNGALSSLLVKYDVVAKRSQANKAINLVRDFLWKKDISMPFAEIKYKDPKDNTTVLRYAQPASFEPQLSRFSDVNDDAQTPLQYWSPVNKKDPAWLSKLKKTIGYDEDHPWFVNFLSKHDQPLKTLSSTAMSRFTPNPANAFDCSDVIFKTSGYRSQIVASHHYFKTAVTEPLDIGSTSSMQDLTDYNHLQFITEKRLQGELHVFMERWGGLFANGEEIPFTLLHQTLIGDEVAFSPDQMKAKSSKLEASVIDSKISANQAIREMLSRSVIVRHKTTGEVKIYNREDFERSSVNMAQYQRVKLNLLQTNDSMNMWYFRTRIRNNDINDSRQLVTNAAQLFEQVKDLIDENDNKSRAELAIIIDFLNSSDHSWFTPSKFKSQAVERALGKLTKKLKNNEIIFQNNNIDRNNLALSLHAAVELKCTVNETWFGSARRNISNFSRDNFRKVPVLGTLVDWLVRGSVGLVAWAVKTVVLAPVYLWNWFKYGVYRKVLFKAAYEGLLADSIGNMTGGCMSALDRAGEMAEQRAAMLEQFHREGKIISYNDSKKTKREFYGKNASTHFKHTTALEATGTPGTSDAETRGSSKTPGLMCNQETKVEQAMASDMAKLRKGKYSEISVEKYVSTSVSTQEIVPVESKGEASKPLFPDAPTHKPTHRPVTEEGEEASDSEDIINSLDPFNFNNK